MPQPLSTKPLKPIDPCQSVSVLVSMPLLVAVAGRCFHLQGSATDKDRWTRKANKLRQSDTYIEPPGSQTSQPAPYGCRKHTRLRRRTTPQGNQMDRFGRVVETYGTEGRGSGSSAVLST